MHILNRMMLYRSKAEIYTRVHILKFVSLYEKCRNISNRRCSLENSSHKYHRDISKASCPYFVTTPIFYVNAEPHIGHLYSVVLADAASIWQRLLGNSVLFSTGTDEHGLKIQQAAQKADMPSLEYCDKISDKFRVLFNKAGIGYSNFIRTTETRHKEAVQEFWRVLHGNGHIYKGVYHGWYSVSDEAFLTEEETREISTAGGTKIRVSAESEQPVTWMEEKNYLFKLSDFKSELTRWLDKGVIQPQKFEGIVRNLLQDLPDLSVSRQRDRLSWGIPVPNDDTQTIYVWLDALVNYLTVAGYPHAGFTWPPNCQIVGKDILKFHAIYWPAFLMAANLEPPRQILCHSHWTVEGVKMSKSRGNVVDPMGRIEKYTSDAFRYFLLREGVPHSDGNYSDQQVINYINSEIVNTLGNLLSRSTSLSINSEQIFPYLDKEMYMKHTVAFDRETFENLEQLSIEVDENYSNFNFYKGIESIMSYLHWANGVVQEHKPWELAKSSSDIDQLHLKVVLHIALETLRVSGILLQPVIPNIACKLLNRLGIPPGKRLVEHSRKPYLNSPNLNLGSNEGILFNKLTEKKSS
ncbi:hypothetical protein CHS0354_019313 [Potamilus streckersoni]|uniref:Methionine--tRNA ligase, mitochondrial n=1 Tax=Potamilus streckersoni TaxID=2493646 RepID=A0AAE0SHD3_9BIVA|nr:hypothetical protein CHS0354_019313 [Potamilus streckersoni]